MLKVINIEEIDIPESINTMDDISNYISDETGFCNFGFDMV